MNSERKSVLLFKYAQNNLSEGESQELEQAIVQGYIQLEELPDHDDLVSYINETDVPPSASLDASFYSMLEQRRPQPEKVIRLSWLYKVAAAAAVLILAFWGGMQWGQRDTYPVVNNSEREVASLISAIPVSEKIDLIATVDLQNGSNKQVINALLFTLNNDASNNVRLACIEALEAYIVIPEVREGLINSIRNQDNPSVIASLASTIRQGGTSLSQEQILNMVKEDIPEPMLNTIKNIY